MYKLRGLATLMGITILGITIFQLYWLKQNYDREKKNLAVKTEITFRETIRQLQGSKLKLEKFFGDSAANGKVRVFVNAAGHGKGGVRVGPNEEIISTIDILKDELRDSAKEKKLPNPGMIISDTKGRLNLTTDSSNLEFEGIPGPKKDLFFRMLYRVDSLRDSLRVKEITSAYSSALKKINADIPFVVSRLDTVAADDGPNTNMMTVGFAHPITYRFDLGNTFPFLIKRIATPILFSIFLLGITILSFVLLYKSLLRQRKLAVLKNEFISNITHELKTPIATVGVAIEALRNFNALRDPQRTKEYLDISQNELQRLSLLVDKVLKLSMFEQKEIELKKETFDLKQLTEEVMNTMKLQFEKYDAKVSMHTEGERFVVEADKLHITSVIYNLLDNALKYSKENPVIEVLLKSYEEHVALSVKDNGIGIPAEYKGKVFDKFFRVPTGDKHNVKGYGLGLSYVSEVAKHHLGFITVESEPGKGSIFTVNIPYKEASVIHYGDNRNIVKLKTKIGN